MHVSMHMESGKYYIPNIYNMAYNLQLHSIVRKSSMFFHEYYLKFGSTLESVSILLLNYHLLAPKLF